MAVGVTPADRLVLSPIPLNYVLIIATFVPFMVILEAATREEDNRPASLPWILIAITCSIFTIYGILAEYSGVRILAGNALFILLVFTGKRLPLIIYIVAIFATVKAPFFSTRVINYVDVAPLLKIHLTYYLVCMIVLYHYFIPKAEFIKVPIDLRVYPKDLLVVLALFLVILFINVPLGLFLNFIDIKFRELSVRQFIPMAFYYIGSVALLEEILFRSLILQALLHRFPKAGPYGWPLVMAALIFGVAHIQSPAYMLVASVAGYFYGAAYLRTKRLSTAILLHGVVDIVWVWFFYRG